MRVAANSETTAPQVLPVPNRNFNVFERRRVDDLLLPVQSSSFPKRRRLEPVHVHFDKVVNFRHDGRVGAASDAAHPTHWECTLLGHDSLLGNVLMAARRRALVVARMIRWPRSSSTAKGGGRDGCRVAQFAHSLLPLAPASGGLCFV